MIDGFYYIGIDYGPRPLRGPANGKLRRRGGEIDWPPAPRWPTTLTRLFAPGASFSTLVKRAQYRNRKGRNAYRKLKSLVGMR